MDILTDQQVLELKLAHKHTKEKRLADRIKAVLMMHMGFTFDQIRQALMLDEVTVRRYCAQYQKNGISGLLEYRYRGGAPRLTTVQQQKLKRFLKEQTLQTAASVVAHIKATYAITYSVIGATKLLHRLGFVYKKPKVVPCKVDRLKQEQFITLYRQTKNQLGVHDKLYFADSTHPQHNTTLAYGWILKGKKNDKFVKTNSGRKRLNLNGALNYTDNRTIVLEEQAINKEATIRLLEAIGAKQKQGKIYVILDNASYHHARVVRQWLLHHPRFKLLFLPAYSPNLNLIERLWKFFHKQITYNHYFETFDEFKTTTLDFFKNLNRYEKELTTLLTDNFQLFPT